MLYLERFHKRRNGEWPTSNQRGKKALMITPNPKPQVSVSGCDGGKPLSWGPFTWQKEEEKKQLYCVIACLSLFLPARGDVRSQGDSQALVSNDLVSFIAFGGMWCTMVRGVMGELKWTARREQQIAASCAALVVWADDGWRGSFFHHFFASQIVEKKLCCLPDKDIAASSRSYLPVILELLPSRFFCFFLGAHPWVRKTIT
jgi:hypothetical protein